MSDKIVLRDSESKEPLMIIEGNQETVLEALRVKREKRKKLLEEILEQKNLQKENTEEGNKIDNGKD